MVEHEVFKRRIILFDKLEEFGFVRENEEYHYSRNIYVGMTARVVINRSGAVTGEVYDEELGEKYVNHRVESANGAFVVGVRNAYHALLEEIAAAVSVEKRYIGEQANRIDAFIAEKYHVSPEFMWEKFPHFGVYRNVASRKWFAIIMNIGKNKVVKGESGEVEVMNLKVDDRTEEFISKGAYPSYHMNHKSWVTVLLDDTVNDDLIAEMLAVSYQNSFPKSRKK